MTIAFVTLKQGSPETGRVKHLQERLKTLGFYSATIDGDFGSQTKAAVVEFQKNNALVADGILGYETEVGIQQSLWVSQRPTLRQGSKGEEVKRLQNLLVDAVGKPARTGETISLDVGAVDGDFGPKTKAAVIKFQNYDKLTADGIVGAKTWNELAGVLAFDLAPEVIYANNVFEVA
ncbi:peptidoglycan-binding domain-containing protein [Calothrix sp. CCY 0018]|uniref:peptidoglycan-binding domain-containing protein n=1 Tax=Calothrix sp. CCY 0018 TaxID=3103864 RepID=UPI0039C6B30A